MAKVRAGNKKTAHHKCPSKRKIVVKEVLDTALNHDLLERMAKNKITLIEIKRMS